MPKNDDLCPLGFVPHSIRPTRCKRCFRGYDEHKKDTPETGNTKSIPKIATPNLPTQTPTNTAVLRRRRPDNNPDSNLSVPTKRRTRTRPCSWSGYPDNQQTSSDNDDDIESPSSPRATRSRRVQIVSTKELRPSLVDEDNEIPETTSADVAFILQVKTSTAENLSKRRGSPNEDQEDDTASVAASTVTTDTTLSYHDSVEDMQATVKMLKRQVDDLQLKCRRLESERSSTSVLEVEELEKTVAELLRLKAQVFELKTSNEELQDDNRVLRLETKELQDELTQVQHRAQQVQLKCEELTNENVELKQEMQDMEEEIDEMQDNFQEDQAGQFHDMRKNMEQLERNCRILQFKLRKAERRCQELEQSPTNAADEKQPTDSNKEPDVDIQVHDKVQRLEAEVRASRQVSMKLHAETEVLRAKLKEKPSNEVPQNEDGQLIRDLYDTIEREKDLKEQLRFSETEATSLRKKLTNLEEENDTLMIQIKKMVGNRPSSKTRREPDGQTRVDDQTSIEMKLQLELIEHESQMLNKKLTELEMDNERLNQTIKTMEKKSKEINVVRLPSSPLKDDDSTDVLHYQQTLVIMETEAKELRRKLIDKQRENEQLEAELLSYKTVRRGSRLPAAMASMRRSASLDSDETTTLDLRRQLQLLEQEALILRQRTLDLENDNDRLVTENKHLEMTNSSKKINSNSSKLAKQETEIKLLQEKIKTLSEHTVRTHFCQRTPKKVTENCTRPELRKYVADLEDEIKLLGATLETKRKVHVEIQTDVPGHDNKELQSMESLKKKVESLETELNRATILSKQIDSNNSIEFGKIKKERDDLRSEVKELKKMSETQRKLKLELEDVRQELKVKQNSNQTMDLRKDIEAKKSKIEELEKSLMSIQNVIKQKEIELQEATSEIKRHKTIEHNYVAELRDRDDDLNRLRDKIKKSEAEIEKLSRDDDVQSELEDRIKGLERMLASEKADHSDLTTRYEALEEDYVIIKAQLVESETQYSEGQLVKNLRETFNLRQDTWIKEKLDMEEKIKELQLKLSRSNTVAWDLEKDLKRTSEQMIKAQEEVARLTKTTTGVQDIQDIQDLQNKLQQEERSHRSEVMSLKFKYDQQLVAYQTEVQALHLQNTKFRRERDAYGLLMKGAQETIADLKSESLLMDSKPTSDKLEELHLKLEETKRDKQNAIDKSDKSERDCSRVKAEFMVEKSSWEIRLAEMQTKINELEEANVLQGSGKSKIVGVKSRLELAWQKERDEQRRLLADAKRQLEELRNHMTNDQTHTQAKIQELQEDLLQLRDAHSKMRSFNDRVRRDKDRMERERDDLRTIVGRTHQLSVNEKRSVVDLVEEVQKIKSMAVGILGETQTRMTRPIFDEEIKDEFKSSLKKISSATEELRRVHSAREDDRIRRNLSYRKAMSEDEDRVGSSIRLPTSMTGYTKDDPLSRWQNPQRVTNYPASPPSMYISPQRARGQLYRKSLSLDQSIGDHSSSQLWRSSENEAETSGGSSVSLMAPTPSPRLKKHLRRARQLAGSDGSSDVSATTSMSSRETSTEPGFADKKPSKGTSSDRVKRSLLRRLTKSKSVEDTPTGDQIKQAGIQALSPGLGSSSSVSEAQATVVKETKLGKDLKSRIANLFKKSTSRSNSIDMGSSQSRGDNAKGSVSKGSTNALSKRYGSTSALHL